MKKDQSQSAIKLLALVFHYFGKKKFILVCDLGGCRDDE